MNLALVCTCVYILFRNENEENAKRDSNKIFFYFEKFPPKERMR